jgi:adenine-specific DNA-methyltransferase
MFLAGIQTCDYLRAGFPIKESGMTGKKNTLPKLHENTRSEMPTLDWIGKQAVVNHHLEVPYRLLKSENELSAGDPDAGNLLVQGDNLLALKALLPYYAGQVKCIYIDPPYNTGNEGWVYNDNVNAPEIKAWLNKVVGGEGEDLSRHDKWLCMMYPRLKLLQKLLHKNGSLVISIGYQEVFNLMPLLKELFSNMQITCATVQTSGGKPSGAFNYQHEYLIFIVPTDFEANPMNFTGGKERTPFEGLTLATFDKTQRPNQTYPIFINTQTNIIECVGKSLQERIKHGSYTGESKDFHYNFNEAPKGTVAIWPITSKGKECVWRLTPNRLLADWEKGYIKVSPNRQKTNSNKYSVQYLPEGVIKKIENGDLKVNGKEECSPTLMFGENKTVGSDIPTIWLEKDFYSVKGTTLLTEIFAAKKFNYPKPLNLIMEILRALTSSDDIILDSFAGSASTAHATLSLNAEDGGNRKFILVEIEEQIAQNVASERLKRVINGYGDIEGLGGGFRYVKLGEPLFDEYGNIREDVKFNDLAHHIFFYETGIPLPRNARKGTPFIGTHNNVGYYLLFNGILGDKTVNGGNILTSKILENLPEHHGPKVIYGEGTRLSPSRLRKEQIVFKQVPYEIRVS